MAHNENKHTEKPAFLEFDPIVLLRDVARRWSLILLVVVIAGMGAYIYETAFYKPVYKTNMTYVTYSRSSTSSVYNNLSAATAVASVFEELLNSSLLHKTIMQESGIESFDGTIQAQVISGTNLLSINVSGPDPSSVFLMAQAIVDHHELVTYQVIDNVSLELLRSPSVPMGPSNFPDPIGRIRKVTILTAVAMIVLLGYLSYRRDAIRSSQEAKSKLNCNYLGDIPHEPKYKSMRRRLRGKQTGILVSNPLSSFRFVEAFRKLASRVEYHMHGKKVVMVTSVLENEGKSTVAVNLAMSMAQKHEKVLLIDCDLRKPACHTLVERRNVAYRVCQVLNGKVDVGQALLQDKKSGLHMLLETKAAQDSESYLNSEAMHKLLQWARENYDLVVLDLPPMALVADAESMMELADCSLLVVRQNASQAVGINKAIATLEDGKAKLLGCVLNNVYSSGLSADSYGYGYGYGYGKYHHYGKYGHYGYYGHHSDQNNK